MTSTPRVLLVLVLLYTGCASVTPPPGQGRNLRYAPHEAAPAALRLHDWGVRESARRGALATHLAMLGAVSEVSASTRDVSGGLSRLGASHQGLAGAGNGIFVRHLEYGQRQRRWIEAELAAATRLATAASQVEDPDMQVALLRLAGPRLEAAMLGSLLLAVWFDFLHLTDDVLSRRLYSVERLYVDMGRFQRMLEPRAGGGRGERHARPVGPPHRRVRGIA